MQRDTYEPVTVSILLPATKEWAEGQTFYDEPVKVRAFTEDDIDPHCSSGKETWCKLPEWQKSEILHIKALSRALALKDQTAIEKAILGLKERAGSIGLGVTRTLLKEPGFAEDFLVKELSIRLDNVRLVLWKTRDRLAPGILCPDIRTACLVYVLTANASLRLCPKCGTTFMQKRPDQDYCSVKCREAHRVERWRKKKAAKKTAKETENPSVVRQKGKK